jgi:hypothetical protein
MAVLFFVFVQAGYGAGPAISNLVVNQISHTTARVEWLTDVPANGAQVFYDSTTATPPFAYSGPRKIEPLSLTRLSQISGYSRFFQAATRENIGEFSDCVCATRVWRPAL